jgi:spermidine synthase
VKPWKLLGEAQTPDGETLTLMRQDDEVVILASGKPLMSSRMHGSEEALASLSCGHLARADAPVVLVGGLGMGFTLRATLDLLPASATVLVAELIPAVVEWNRGPIGELARHPLKDRRVQVVVSDVLETLRGSTRRFDAVLLDVDNGPDAFTTSRNAALYRDEGLRAIRSALEPAGVLGVWSAWEDRKFEQRLRYHGFVVEVHRVRARLKQGGPRHTIFLGRSIIAPSRGRCSGT